MANHADKPLSAKAQRALQQEVEREYRLHAGERADDGVRRVAHGRVDSALEQLREGTREDLATAVHDTRKDMKKLRSLVRLVRDELGEKRYRRENERFRDAARALASSRDAEVKLETLAGLRKHYGDEVPTLAALERDLTEERDRIAAELAGEGLGAQIEQATAAIEQGGDKVDAWPLERSGWKLMRSGLERSYRRGRQRLEVVRADPTPEAIHDWRKRVKDLWYHLRLLREIWPEGMEGPTDEAHVLSDLLGDHHDLTVLADEIEGRSNGDADTAALLALTVRRQQELLDEALPLGERLYAEKPTRFVERLGAYWSIWKAD